MGPWGLVLLLQLLILATVGLRSVSTESQGPVWAIELIKPSDAATVAAVHGCRLIGRLNLINHFALVQCRHHNSPFDSNHLTRRLRRHAGVIWAEQQFARRRVKRDYDAAASNLPNQGLMEFNDPFYPQQWYLLSGANGGRDLDVSAVWSMGYTGRGSVVSILDDGIEHWHSDLKDNYDSAASYDVNGHDEDPAPRDTPTNINRHGTRCAGEVSAKAGNGVCAVGIAFEARIGGIRMLDGPITDSVEAQSLSYNQGHIDIYSASWGPDDDGRTVDGPGRLAKQAFVKGVTTGRNGLGNIFIWASGNGGHKSDSCACDGYTNSIYTLSVSSITQRNSKPWYLEECASTLAATYSSGGHGDKQVVTTDLHNQCTSAHTGTSASAPIAAAIVALVLQANRNLTWRDVLHVTVLGADSGDFLTDAEWLRNAAGLRHSRRYGFGLMSAARMVALARLWARPVPHLLRCQCDPVVANQQVPVQGALSIAVVVGEDGCGCDGGVGVGKRKIVRLLESVQLHLDASFSNRGQLQVTLISPSGTKSLLLTPRPYDNNNGDCGFQAWPLMSVQFWRENPAGKWQILVENRGSPSNHGRVATATLVFYGTESEPIQLRRPTPPLPDWLAPWNSVMLTEPAGSLGCHRLCADGDNCSGLGPGGCQRCRHFYRPVDANGGGVCVEACRTEDGEYADNAKRVCGQCHSACRVCKGPGNRIGDCLACRSQSVLLLGATSVKACLPAGSTCPSRHYSLSVAMVTKGAVSTTKTAAAAVAATATACAPCPTGCSDCSANHHPGLLQSVTMRFRANCSACLPGYLLLQPSGICYFGQQCPAGHVLSANADGICFACPDAECSQCARVHSSTSHSNAVVRCFNCRDPLRLSPSDGRCIDPVVANTGPCLSKFLTDNGCSACLSNSNVCILCQSDLFMDILDNFDNGSSRCLKACPSERPYACRVSLGSSMTSSQCSAVPCNSASLPGPCPMGQFFVDKSLRNDSTVGHHCLPCDASCRTCSGPGAANCTSCRQGLACLSKRHMGHCLTCGQQADCDPVATNDGFCLVESNKSDDDGKKLLIPTTPSPGNKLDKETSKSHLSAVHAVYAFVGIILAIVLICLVGYFYCGCGGSESRSVDGSRHNGSGHSGVGKGAGGVNGSGIGGGGGGVKYSYSQVSQSSPSGSPERSGLPSQQHPLQHVVCAGDSPSSSSSASPSRSPLEYPEEFTTALKL